MTGSNMAVRHLATLAMIAAAAACVGDVRGQNMGGDLRRCLPIIDDAARLDCIKGTAPGTTKRSQPLPPSIGDWRWVRTPDPRGGPDAISIMHTADMSRSDAGLAGLMLRCAQDGIEALVIVVAPLPPRAHARIRFGSPDKQQLLDAEVIPPFTALRLPREAPSIAAALEASGANALAIDVDGKDGPIQGTVALAGLRPALEGLSANCRNP
jgi:hypothetical protein